MGIWAGIKRALNSTVGTSDFAPLDKIYIRGKSLIPSEKLYVNVYLDSTYINQDDTPFLVPKKVKMKTSGSARIQVLVESAHKNSTGILEIYKNDVLISSVESARGENLDDTNRNIGTTIMFNENDVLSFRYRNKWYYAASTGNVTLQDLSICAELVDTSILGII